MSSALNIIRRFWRLPATAKVFKAQLTRCGTEWCATLFLNPVGIESIEEYGETQSQACKAAMKELTTAPTQKGGEA